MERTGIYKVFWSGSPLDLWDVLSTIGRVSFYRSEKPIQPENRQTWLSSKGSVEGQWTNSVWLGTEIRESQGLSGKPDLQLSKFATLAKFLSSPIPECWIYDIVVKRLASTAAPRPSLTLNHSLTSCVSVSCLEADDPPSEVLLEGQ